MIHFLHFDFKKKQFFQSLTERLLKISHFFSAIFSQFMQNGGMYRASALTFTSLLAIVPLMSVCITVMSVFPLFESLTLPLQNFIFDNFVPESGKIVQNYIQTFARQASELSLSGLAFLFITVVLMLFNVIRFPRAKQRLRSSSEIGFLLSGPAK